MPLNPAQAQTAQLIYTLAKARGLPDQRAREMVAASYAESGLNPTARNKSSGASGLFQLLSSGYVNRANAQGGTTNPRANFNAIAPDYVSYWQSHPNAAPGEAAAAVERSGQGAGFYAAPLAKIGALGAARSPGVDSLTSLGLSSSAGQPAAGADPSLRRAFAMQLIAANQAGQGGRTVDYAPVLASLSALRQGGSQAVDSQPMNAAPPGAGGSHSRWVTLGANADRQGVAIKPAVLDFVGQIGQLVGRPLTIGTGTNHNEYVQGTHRESDHWTGYAADIPATGAELTRLGQAALVAAGADPKWAAQQQGGLYNIGGKQVIFNSNEGGNHYNHLHVGIRTR